MQLTLDKRPCRIGVSINTRREMHGDEPVPAMDIPITGVLLDKSELNALLGDDAHGSLFTKQGNRISPTFAKSLKPFSCANKFCGEVALHVGLAPQVVVLNAAKLSKLKLEPQEGGLTALSLTVQCSKATDEAAQLLQFLDNSADVAIVFGDDDAEEAEEQDELELEHADA